MAKRKKIIKKISLVEVSNSSKGTSRLDCFGNWTSVCRQDLCGEYYEKCRVKVVSAPETTSL